MFIFERTKSFKFKTDNVINMGYIFYLCSSLNQLNISSFKTDNVINIEYMFFDCTNLEELNLLNFNTAKVMDMRYMFRNCHKWIFYIPNYIYFFN